MSRGCYNLSKTISSMQLHYQPLTPIPRTMKKTANTKASTGTLLSGSVMDYHLSNLCGIIVFMILVLTILVPTIVTGKETMDELMTRLETEVIHLSYAVHLAFEPDDDTNCDWLTSCVGNNYEHCSSKFPNEICYNTPFNDTSIVSSCERDFQCGTKFDFTTSAVRIAEVSLLDNNNNDMKHRIFESICRTQTLDDDFFIPWWKESILNDRVEPRAIMFGSSDGMLRAYPGRQTSDVVNTVGKCDDYDPRMRPWYNAASTAGHSVILLVDLSQSITSDSYTNLQRIKDAVSRVVTATTLSDLVGIITFDASETKFIGNCSLSYTSLCQGNAMNKEFLISTINQLNSSSSTSRGTSNFSRAYDTTFDLISQYDIQCSTSIMLFTDDPKEARDAIQAHQARIEQIEKEKKTSMTFYGYVLMQSSKDDVNDYDCVGSTFHTGIWSRMTNDREIVSALLPYFEIRQVAYEVMQQEKMDQLATNDYKENRRDDVAWVEPYNFSMFGVVGTTVSAPVYDSNGRLLGVVGINYGLDSLKNGVYDYNVEKIINRAKDKTSQDACLDFDNLSPCMFQFDQRTNYNVLCNTNANSIATITPSTLSSTFYSTNTTGSLVIISNTCNSTRSISSLININLTESKKCCTTNQISCEDITQATSSLWNNRDYDGSEYIKRGCCTSNDTSDSANTVNKFTFTGSTSTNSQPEQCIIGNNQYSTTTTTTTTTPGGIEIANTSNTDSTTQGADRISENSNVVALAAYGIAGFVGVASFFALLFFAPNIVHYMKYQRSRTTYYNSSSYPIPRTRPPAVPPAYDD